MKVDTATVRPGPAPASRSATCRAAVPLAQAIACRAPTARGELALEAVDERPDRGDLVGPYALGEVAGLVAAEVRLDERDHRWYRPAVRAFTLGRSHPAVRASPSSRSTTGFQPRAARGPGRVGQQHLHLAGGGAYPLLDGDRVHPSTDHRAAGVEHLGDRDRAAGAELHDGTGGEVGLRHPDETVDGVLDEGEVAPRAAGCPAAPGRRRPAAGRGWSG